MRKSDFEMSIVELLSEGVPILGVEVPSSVMFHAKHVINSAMRGEWIEWPEELKHYMEHGELIS